MDKKLGVYICTGCGIGETLDIEKLEKKVPPKIEIRKTHPIVCSPEGVELIKQDIANEGVNTVSISALLRGGLDLDIVYVDSLDITYERRYAAPWTGPPGLMSSHPPVPAGCELVLGGCCA